MREALESAGALAEGETGYTHAKELWGHMAVAQNTQGMEIVVAALDVGEVSNDHHPYYEAAFTSSYEAAFTSSPTGELTPLEIRRYGSMWLALKGSRIGSLLRPVL